MAAVGVGERRTRTAAAVAVIAVLAAVGAATPLMPLALRVVSGVAPFRFPEKYLPIATVAWVMVASGALEGLGRSSARRRRFLCAALPAKVLLVLGIAVVVLSDDTLDALARATNTLPAPPDQPLASAPVRSAALQPLLALLAALIAAQWTKHRARPVLLVATLDVVLAGASLLQVGPSLRDARSALAPFGRTTMHGVPVLCVDPRLENNVVVNAQVGGPWTQALFARQWGCRWDAGHIGEAIGIDVA